MNYENQQILEALDLQLTTDATEELREWQRFFLKNPTRTEVLQVCCAEMNAWAEEMPVPNYRIWAHESFVDNQIALHYAFAPGEFFDNRFQASVADLCRDAPHFTPVRGYEQAYAQNPVFVEGVRAIRARLAYHLPAEPEVYYQRFASGVNALRDLLRENVG